MTNDTAARPALDTPSPPREGYAALWRRVPARIGALTVGFGLGMLSLCVLTFLFLTGISLSILGIGLVLVAFSLVVARRLGVLHNIVFRLAGLPVVPEPVRAHAQESVTSWKATREELRSQHDWASLLHGLLVAPFFSSIAFMIGILWVGMSVNILSPLWISLLSPVNWAWGAHLQEAMPFLAGWETINVVRVAYVLLGIVAIVTLPWVLRGLVAMQRSIARPMLGPWEEDDLRNQIAEERAARSAALAAEDSDLRRLERDLHDGPQQRLIRVQMDASLMERRAKDGDAAAAADLASAVRSGAQEALAELRALSSGVAPPLLQDRGFTAAIAAVAELSPVPVRVEADPSVDARVSSEAARSLYFVVAELLTNSTKHAQAANVLVRTELVGDELLLQVSDDGVGGAVIRPGHGLAGLQSRLRGLRATFDLASNETGTTVLVRVPVPSA